MSESALIEAGAGAIIEEFLPQGMAEAYIEALLKENERVNLVSRETSREDLRRLVAESILPLRFLSTAPAKYLDIGSGGGLPAVPLMQAFAHKGEEVETFLMEPRQKKAAALRRICLALKLRPEIIKEPFPEKSPRGPVDLITIRLVKLTSGLLQAARDCLSNSGQLVYFGKPEDDFITAETDCKSIAYRLDGSQAIKHISLISKN